MTSLTEHELARYHRQMIIPAIGEAGQERLKQARVAVIGAGGLGSPVLLYLAAAGIGTIRIVDGDTVSVSNLQRQVIYVESDVGCLKAEASARRLSLLNPFTTLEPCAERLTRENADALISGQHVAVDCTDNYASRYLVSDATRKAGIPLVYGAVYQFMGQASVFNYRGGPSYRDVFPEEMHGRGGDSIEPPGVIGVLPGIVGAVQACEVIKIVTGVGDVLSRQVLQIDALGLKADLIAL